MFVALVAVARRHAYAFKSFVVVGRILCLWFCGLVPLLQSNTRKEYNSRIEERKGVVYWECSAYVRCVAVWIVASNALPNAVKYSRPFGQRQQRATFVFNASFAV